MSLFDDDSHDVEFSFEAKPEIAKRYMQKKKREELTKLQDKYKGIDEQKARKISSLRRKYGNDIDATDALDDVANPGANAQQLSSDDDMNASDSSSSEEEDEIGELVTPEVDAQILKTIAMIRSKNPAVYDPKAAFFSQQELEAAQQGWKTKLEERKSRPKKVTLKDMEREQVLKGIVDLDEASEAQLAEIQNLSHAEQQERLRAELKAAAFADDGSTAQNDDDDEDMLFTSVVKTDDQLAKEEEEYKAFLLESMASAGGEGYFSAWHEQAGRADADGNLADPNDQFLMDYILNRGWIDKDDKKSATASALWAGDDLHPAVDPGVASDEENAALDAADGFEREYNFRFEEAAALAADGEDAVAIRTHARAVPDSVRRPDDKRKRARDARNDRKEAEKLQKQEELKRLKNLKRDEILAKLREIQEITGNEDVGFDEVDIEAEFDPDQWDSKMSQVFNDDYYSKADAEYEKPEWDEDIDIDDLVAKDPVVAAAPVPAPAAAPVAAATEGKKKRKKRRRDEDEDQDDFIELPDADAMDVEYVVPAPQKSSAAPAASAAPYTGPRPTGAALTAAAKQAATKALAGADLDELYKLDYEDIVGGMPVRFRYRDVRAVSFGLSAEDILDADDTDLNQFVSLKKLAPFREPEREDQDVRKYSKKHRLAEFRQKLAEKQREMDQQAAGWSHHGNNGKHGGGGGGRDRDADQKREQEDRLAAYQPQTKGRKRARHE
ncbi:KRI1-like family C-terminal-domain-containing protein [Blastocladiella britannica]|nr:KRI1-like family C-terminal-domain-containing protein [Blastocladiella britannica]